MNYLKTYNENKNTNILLGFHSSKLGSISGLNKGVILNEERYSDIIKYAYMEIISDYDKNIETDNISAMNKAFSKKNYGFTYVSKYPIKGSAFQPEKYKYGNYLYEVYGTGLEFLLDDPNEVNAEIIVSKNPLFFKLIS